MVAGFTRSPRITTLVAFGGISIAAAILYIVLRKKANKKSQEDSSSSSSNSVKEASMSRAKQHTANGSAVLSAVIPVVEDSSVKNKENAPLPDIIATNDNELGSQKPDAIPESLPEDKKLSPVSIQIEKKIEKLNVSKNGAEAIERELSPIEKMLASDTPVIDWAECSYLESETERNANAGENDTSSTHSVEEKIPNNSTTVVTNEMTATNGQEYKMADSPSVDSTHSEVSNDSGRATVTAPSMFGNSDFELGIMPMYEFEVPNTLVGLIIGVRGKTIRELCTRADVRILIRPHHDHAKIDTHQICSIEGKRDDINKCLHMMRHRFPPNRFPDLNLKPVFPPPVQPPVLPSSDLMQLSLPAGVPCEVFVSAPVDAGHFFVQLPTHPTFPTLSYLDETMSGLYYHRQFGPLDCIKPPKNSVNLMCAAPAGNGWYRALTLCYDEKQDEMLVRFVDYGGFARMARADLRYLLRHDLLTIPFQSIECYLADVEPIDGTSWTEEANKFFQKMCTQKIIEAELVGHSRFDGLPFVRLFIRNRKNEQVRFDTLLLKRGHAKPWDLSRLVPLPVPQITITTEDGKPEIVKTQNIEGQKPETKKSKEKKVKPSPSQS